MGEDRADERRRRPLPPGQPPAEHRDARQLADAPGSTAFANRPTENAEKTSGKCGCGRSIDCLIARVPREGACEHREQVEPDRRGDPLPRHRAERVVDDLPVRTAPDDQRDGEREERHRDEELPAAPHAAAST